MLGRSPVVDILLHCGLGIAAATTLIVTGWAVSLLVRSRLSITVQNLLRAGLFVPIALAQLSIVAFIGATKGLSDRNSMLGYAFGGVATLLVAWQAYRQATKK